MTDHGRKIRFLTRLLVVPVLLLAAACGGADDRDDSAIAAAETGADQAVAAATAAADSSYGEYGYEADGSYGTDGPATPGGGGSVASLDDILALSSRFEQAATWGAEAGGVRFLSPNGMTIDAAGNVYVTEFRGGHLRKFTPNGDLLFEVAGNGIEPGLLANPTGVAVDSEGTIYVAESGSSRVTRLAAID